MLNIGKLAPNSADYYIGEIATSADDYYTGHGEAPGRWVGSLAAELGLHGQVDPEHFRRVLDGRHPFTGDYLTTAQGSAARAAARRPTPPTPRAVDGVLDTLQAGAQLGLSERRVRQLLEAGETGAAQRAAEVAAGLEQIPLPRTYLLGQRVARKDGRGDAWLIAQEEVDRFAAAHRKPKHRPGYDVVLRPPKSVSILWALGDDHARAAVRRAHRDAVDQTIDYLEATAATARTKGQRVATHGYVAAAFDHRTSRAGDPLLHTHVVIANMTRTIDGAWQSLDARGLYDRGRSAGALYQAHLRHTLTATLGVAWAPIHNGYADIAGVSRSVIDTFSKRRDEITELVAESGLTSARAHQTATLITRTAKDHSADPETLQRQWHAEASGAGFTDADLTASLHRTEPQPVTTGRLDRLFENLASVRGLTERAASFNRADVISALAAGLGADADATTIVRLADQFLASDRVAPLVDAATGRQRSIVRDSEARPVRVIDETRFTTPELLDLETRILDWATHGFGAPAPTASPAAIETAVAARPGLSAEQVAMVRSLCSGDESIQPLAGRAGSGKTTALAACAEAFVASGIPVVGCSVSATAAARLEQATGLGELTGRPCETVAKLLYELDSGGDTLAPGAVCLVDEASALSTRDLARLADHVRRAGGAIKLVGDPDQLSSVDVGGAFRAIATSRRDHLLSLTANLRQRDPEERLAVADYRAGRIAEALGRYDAAGKITRATTLAASLDAIAGDWYRDRLAGIHEPMMAGPNSLRRRLNDRARQLLKADGTLRGPALTVAGTEFCVGDEIVTRHNDRRLRSPDRRTFVKNGSRGTIVAVDPAARTLTIDFTREGRIRLPAAYIDRGHVEHAYAQTNFLAQGVDQQRTKYHPTDASRFEEGYVGITRAVDETRIYLVDGQIQQHDTDIIHSPERAPTGLETVTDALTRRGTQKMAHDLDAAAGGDRALGSLTLFGLRLQRERLEATLGSAPPPVDTSLAAAERSREQLLAKRQLWRDNLRDAQAASTSTAERHAEGQLARIDRALTTLDRKLERLRDAHAARRAFLDAHREEVHQLEAVCRAERAQELQVRLAARTTPQPDLACRLPMTPMSHRERVAFDHAAEEVAVYRERYGAPPTGQVLGSRPRDVDARLAFDRTRQAVERAAELVIGEPTPHAPELAEPA